MKGSGVLFLGLFKEMLAAKVTSLRIVVLGLCRRVKALATELQSSTYRAVFLDRQQVKGFVPGCPWASSAQSLTSFLGPFPRQKALETRLLNPLPGKYRAS